MSIFVCYTNSIARNYLVHIMGCHGNHTISHNQNEFFFEDNIVLHLSYPIEQIGVQKKLS